MIEELAELPRNQTRLYVWVIDSVNEMRGLASVRPLVPSILSLTVESILINPPGIQL